MLGALRLKLSFGLRSLFEFRTGQGWTHGCLSVWMLL